MIKHFFTLALVSGLAATGFAQGDLEFFSENGERFFVVMNGQQYNQEPQTNVKVYDLNTEWVKTKIVFENEALKPIDQNTHIEYGSMVTYMITTNKKGNYVFRYRGPSARPDRPVEQPVVREIVREQPVYQQPQPTDTRSTTVVQHEVRTNQGGMGDPMGISMGMSLPDGEGGTINVGVSGGENGMGFGISGIPDGEIRGGVGISGSGTHTTTTTTTIQTSGGYVQPAQQPVQQPVYQPVQPQVPAGRCVPMNSGDFNEAKSSIENKDFAETQMTLAKQIISANCMTSSQIKQVMEIFDFEANRLDFAKYAYRYCSDPQNYYKVNDAFDFESSIDDLNRAIGK